MITQSHVNQVISMDLGLSLTQAFYLDYLVKRTLISDESRISLSRNETVAKLPVIFNRLDTVYRSIKALESVGAIEVFSTGKIDVIEVNPSIVSGWLAGLEVDFILSIFLKDFLTATLPHVEPSIIRAKKNLIPNDIRLAIFERDKCRCQACDTHLELSIDHVIPESKGGSSEPANLQTLCLTCNKSKGTKTMEEWSGGAK